MRTELGCELELFGRRCLLLDTRLGRDLELLHGLLEALFEDVSVPFELAVDTTQCLELLKELGVVLQLLVEAAGFGTEVTDVVGDLVFETGRSVGVLTFQEKLVHVN